MLTSLTNVTDDPGSKPDQRYAGQRDRQNYIPENYVKIQDFRAIRIPVCVQHIGTLGGGGGRIFGGWGV